jgi:hypothetical protein
MTWKQSQNGPLPPIDGSLIAPCSQQVAVVHDRDHKTSSSVRRESTDRRRRPLSQSSEALPAILKAPPKVVDEAPDDDGDFLERARRRIASMEFKHERSTDSLQGLSPHPSALPPIDSAPKAIKQPVSLPQTPLAPSLHEIATVSISVESPAPSSLPQETQPTTVFIEEDDDDREIRENVRASLHGSSFRQVHHHRRYLHLLSRAHAPLRPPFTPRSVRHYSRSILSRCGVLPQAPPGVFTLYSFLLRKRHSK